MFERPSMAPWHQHCGNAIELTLVDSSQFSALLSRFCAWNIISLSLSLACMIC